MNNKKDQSKISCKISAFIILFSFIFISLHFTSPEQEKNKLIDDYYTSLLSEFKSNLHTLANLTSSNNQPIILQKKFGEARVIYKKMAVLSEYFNNYETKFLNGPAIDRVEDDNPDVIISPTGLQQIEQLIYSTDKKIPHEKVITTLEEIFKIIDRLEREPDRVFKFKDELVWDALRSAVVRLSTLGISGFDSPVANLSLLEAKASLDGIINILAFFKDDINKKDAGLYPALTKTITSAQTFVDSYNHFIQFDRLTFIKKFLDPLYSSLIEVRNLIGIKAPEGRNPINFEATSMFSSIFFDINFFSPPDPYTITAEKIELGKKLFFDPILSGTKNRSCASCHQPEKAFTDGLRTPLGMDNKTPLSRNTPTLWNSAFQTKQFFDSRTTVLENQLDEVVHNESEMKGSLKISVTDLTNHAEYALLFKKAFPSNQKPIVEYNIANAISSYVRSLISLNSRFDKYMRGDEAKMNLQERNGFNLFMGKAKCGTCHFVPLFNGLVPPEFTETESEILGVPKTKKGSSLDPDLGKFGFTNSVIHRFSFKTPSLRNIELTAPYMHNGVFKTLEEVLEFYNKGGGKGLHIAPENQTLPFDRLDLAKKEIKDIIAFMKTLTDTTWHR